VIVTAHQLTFAPWLGLFDKIARADTLVLMDTCQVEQGGYENRVRIRTREGTQWLTVPIQHRGKPVRMCDALIAEDGGRWRRKHMRTWDLAYGSRAPHAKDHLEFLREVYSEKWEGKSLVDMNALLIGYLVGLFGLHPRIVWLSDLDLGLTSNGSQLILDICQALGAKRFVFGALGAAYADLEAFRRAGVDVEFQNYKPFPYPQAWPGFEPGMSAFDLLMNTPLDQAREIMRGA
jgi:hypothetical protein